MLVAMWRMGFFFHEVAFGLLSVFIPLYVVTFPDVGLLGGKLLAVGIMTSVALFCAIPGSFLWGFLCDATRRYKVFILLSFASSAAILFLMTLPFASQSIVLFVVLYVVMQVLHVAHEAPKNVLIAEHYSREEWEKSYGFYEALTEVGFIAGLAIGMIAFLDNIGANYILYLCSGLSFVALILAIALIADPLMIFERRLVGIEKRIDFTARGLESSSRMMDGLGYDGGLKRDSFLGFALAIVLFSLATSLFFTPLPLYLKGVFNGQVSMVYVFYILNSVGATAGYLIIRERARNMNIRKEMPRYILLRGALIFVLVGVVEFAIFPSIFTAILLMGLGFAYGMYYIMMLSMSMEIIPEGKAGLFDGLVGLGAAVGAFLGPFLAMKLNYMPMFVIAAVIFLFAYVAFKLSA